MSWFDRPAPVEPSAAERNPTAYYDSSCCAACLDRRGPNHQARVGEYQVLLCDNPRECRERAQAAGIWKVAR